MPHFERYIGIDYSGAQTPTSPLKGLRVYVGLGELEPIELRTFAQGHRYWTRRGLAEWLQRELASGPPTLVGIDHAFSFPVHYFEHHRLPFDWDIFLMDFCAHWPTDSDNTYVDFVRDGLRGNGAARTGDSAWLRLTEKWTPAAKSVFLFDIQGAVAKSTHSGLPWLRYLRKNVTPRPHFWPFDGWEIPPGRSAIVEVYPALWTRRMPRDARDPDQHAAYSAAAWLSRHDQAGTLTRYLAPPLTTDEKFLARFEGWILGVV